MKKLLLLLSFVVVSMAAPAAYAQCNAQFTWEQIPGTLQIHFNSTSTSEQDIVSYFWNFGDTHTGDGENPYHTYSEPGTYLVCLTITAQGGCVDDVCHEVTVAPVSSNDCEAQFTWEQIPNTFQIHFNSTSTSEFDIISYQWNFGDGDTGDGDDPYHTYDEPGTYVVCLIITDNHGCVSDVCHEVTVEGIDSECNAQFTWEQFQGSYEVDFTSTSTSDHDIVSFQWNFGDGSSGEGPNPSHTYDEPGVYVVCLIITNEAGCVSDVCHEVHVEATSGDCHAQFTWEQIPGTLQIHFNSTSTSEHDIVSYSWQFGDGTEGDGDDPYHTYEEPGVYVVCLTITDASGCVSEVCHEVHVEALDGECHAQFTWEQIPGTMQIHFNSTSTSEFDIVSYSWQFGDGTEGDGDDPYHTYEESGTYLVCLTITDASGCVSEVCHEVHVGEPEGDCHADFEWNQIDDTFEIHFQSTSTSEHDIISYQWNFGDGHFGEGPHPNHTYEGPGTYVVCLRIEDNTGCVSEICHEVHIVGVEGCHAIFTWDFIPGTLNVHFFSHSTSEHDIISYLWTFGDGQSSDDQNPLHEYSEPGTYLVCLRIEDNTGCVSEICHEVTVGEEEQGCHAIFTWDLIPGTLGVHFFSHSTSEHDIISYQWTFGDGQSSDDQNPSHEYNEPGTYLVCLRIEDNTGCVSEICHEVTVGEEEEECNASFSFETNDEGVVFFNNTSTGGTEHTTWFWDFDDGETSTEENPHHVYEEPGIYTVCLIMADSTLNCSDQFCLTLTSGLQWEEGHYDESRSERVKADNISSSFVEGKKVIRYTNPVSDDIIIDYYLDIASPVAIEIYDLSGYRLVADFSASAQQGKHQKSIDISHLQPGMYLLSVTTGQQRKTMGVTISR